MISAAARAMAWSTPFGSSDEDTIWVSRASVRNRLINGATALCSTPSYALHLAEVARERGVPLEMDEVRLLLEVGDGADHVLGALRHALRVDLGIRVDLVAVPARSLQRYELKAKRLVRCADA